VETRTIGADEREYPEAMGLLALVGNSRLRRAPPLYVRGSLPARPGVAVVGTRKATNEALAFTRELVKEIAAAGCAIWSGGALGIDASAHQAALDVGAPTVVVTAGGLDDPYPPTHASLYSRVLNADGALMSLQDDGEIRLRYQFLQRNYVLAALTIATVLVQAPRKSGARYTTKAARRLGRALFIVPGEPWSLKGAGCAEELATGGVAIADPTQFGEQLSTLAFRAQAGGNLLLPFAARASPKEPPREPLEAQAHSAKRANRPLDAGERAVLAALSAKPMHADSICGATGLPFPEVARALSGLSLERVVVEAPPGMYRRADCC
jgi:DNA processing protein